MRISAPWLIGIGAAGALVWLLWEATPALVPEPTLGRDPPGPTTAPVLRPASRPPIASTPTVSTPAGPTAPAWRLPSRRPLAPHDPAERGTCRLVVDLVGDASGEALESYVTLWRIDEPGTKAWSRGDRNIGRATTTDGPATWKDLAPGRYRVYVHAQRKKTSDPEAFAVAGVETHLRLAIPEPESFPVRVKVFDRAARTIREATVLEFGPRHGPGRGGRPTWIQRRTLRGPSLHYILWGQSVSSSHGYGRGRRTERVLHGDARGLWLGRIPGGGRDDGWKSVRRITVEGRSAVRLDMAMKAPLPSTYVAASMPMAEIHDMVRLPDGTRAIDAGATITAVCKAVAVSADGEERPWDRLTIEVEIRLDGYCDRRLYFSHRMRRRPFTLKPLPRK